MTAELHRAVHGDVWARPEPPAEVWRDLLGRVTAERALADDLADALDKTVAWRFPDDPDVQQVLARHRETRQR